MIFCVQCTKNAKYECVYRAHQSLRQTSFKYINTHWISFIFFRSLKLRNMFLCANEAKFVSFHVFYLNKDNCSLFYYYMYVYMRLHACTFRLCGSIFNRPFILSIYSQFARPLIKRRRCTTTDVPIKSSFSTITKFIFLQIN